MKKLLLSLLLIPTIAYAAVTFPVNGGTGTSTKPTIGQILLGLSNGTYAPVATSSLGITSGITYTGSYPIIVSGSVISTGFSTSTFNIFTAENKFNATTSVTELRALGSAGIDLHNNTGGQVALFGTGGGTGTSLFGGLNVTGHTALTTASATTAFTANNLYLPGSLFDSVYAAGTNGMILKSTGTSTQWVATSSLFGAVSSGTVTSVSLTTPTGLTAASTTCTTICILGITLTSGYIIPLTASTTEWSTAYASTTALTPAYIKSQITGTYPIIVTNGVVSTGFSTSTTNNYTGVNTFTVQTNLANASSTGISTTNLFATGTVALATTTITGNLSVTGAIIPRVVGYTASTSITINLNTTDEATTTVSHATTTFENPTGTAIDGFMYLLTVTATTTRSLAWGTQFASSTDLSFPTSVASGTTEILWKYDKFKAKYLLLGLLKTFQ